jgi:Ca2+-transporting ATPase
VLLLIVACIVSFALGQFVAGTAILVILILNASLGVTMEYRAGLALDALSSL